MLQRLLNEFLGVAYCLIWAGFVQDALYAFGILGGFFAFMAFDLSLRLPWWHSNFKRK